ncbi:Octanoyltransferase [compost metagenome]
MSRPLRVADLGRIPYPQAWELQKKLVDLRADDHIEDHLLLLEHEPVITLGRKADPAEHVCEAGKGVPTFEIERGGEATYHAPGQLVGYFILKLEGPERDLHRLLRQIEEIQIRALARWGIEAGRNPGKTGVWVGDRKISSIGVAVRRWVTYHGLGLNVSTDLGGFQAIRPCGMEAGVMTSMEALLGKPVAMDEVKAAIASEAAVVLDRTVLPADLEPTLQQAR